MLLFLIILTVLLAYLLIKGWVGFVNLIFNPLIARSEKRASQLRVKKAPQPEPHANSIVGLQIASIKKTQDQFTLHVCLGNTSNDTFHYALGDCYYITTAGLQLEGDASRLIFGIQNAERVLPGMHIKRSITFYDTFSDFSEADRLVCSVEIGGTPHLITASLHGITSVQLAPSFA